ncbi:unnamed protein product [Prunus armeniaca]|uniref:Uncharacterized protein n=1 Tax=Prunus armeniaca TaxID=36596 RepID=A0A6J5VPY8_PRUAR|nr:unnamed protein product [Prunus armeniaca]CAB4321345.1 unnamed protein product [Prunus armeniaca]
MEPNIPNLPYILTTPFSEPVPLVKRDASIDPRLNRLRNTYIPWQNVTHAKNHIVLQRQKCHDPPKPVEMKKSKGKGGKGSSSRNPEPDPLVEANQAFIQSQNNFAAAIRSFIPGPNCPLMDRRLHVLAELTDEFEWTNQTVWAPQKLLAYAKEHLAPCGFKGACRAEKVLVVITGTLFLFVYVELQQAPELRIERLVKKALILLGSLQGLYSMYGFDAEVSPFLQWSQSIGIHQSARSKCVNADPHTLTTTAPSGQHHPCSIP